MSHLKVVYKPPFEGASVPRGRFWDDKEVKREYPAKVTSTGDREYIIPDNAKNRDFVERSTMYSVVKEEAKAPKKKLKKPTGKPVKKVSREKMQAEMDEKDFEYGQGGLISDKKMATKYKLFKKQEKLGELN